MQDLPLFSIIIPVKNEAVILDRSLESLSRLDYPRERFEIIVCDGLSTDNTREVASRFGAKIVTNEKQIVVSGRNRGFEKALGDIIVFTDADCVFDSKWLKHSIKYFNDETVGGVGGLSLAPEDGSAFEKAINFIFYLADMLKTTAHKQEKSLLKTSEVRDIPGCNAFYRKEALAKIMPVDEGLLTAEDVWMNYCIRKSGYRLIFASDAILWHHRRSSVLRFFRQIYRFAIGRLQVGKRSLVLLNFFHVFFGFGIPLALSLVWIFLTLGALSLLLKMTILFFGVLILLSLVKTKSFRVSLNIPLAVIIFALAWSFGFLRELTFPLKDVTGK